MRIIGLGGEGCWESRAVPDLVDLVTWLYLPAFVAVGATLLLLYLWLRSAKTGEIRLSGAVSPKAQRRWVWRAFWRGRATSLPERFERMDSGEFEAEVSELLRGFGYTVRPIPTSNIHDVDLLLQMSGCRVAVQLRRWNAPVGDRSVYGLFTGRIHYGTDEAWLITTSRFTPKAMKLAETTGVRLVDGDELAQWLDSRPEEDNFSAHRGEPSTSAKPATLEESSGVHRSTAESALSEPPAGGGSTATEGREETAAEAFSSRREGQAAEGHRRTHEDREGESR